MFAEIYFTQRQFYKTGKCFILIHACVMESLCSTVGPQDLAIIKLASPAIAIWKQGSKTSALVSQRNCVSMHGMH